MLMTPGMTNSNGEEFKGTNFRISVGGGNSENETVMKNTSIVNEHGVNEFHNGDNSPFFPNSTNANIPNFDVIGDKYTMLTPQGGNSIQSQHNNQGVRQQQ